MSDISVHVRLQKCCRKALKEIDKKKKKAKFSRGLLAAPSLLDIFGEKPVDRARALVPTGGDGAGAARATSLGDLQEVTLKTCRTICEKHAEKHEGAGENLEATFWREFAVGLDGEPRKEPAASRQADHTVADTPTPLDAGRTGMDINKAVEHLNSSAHAKSTGECAIYVHNAIQAGGVNIPGANAKDMGPILESAGFSKVATQETFASYIPTAGDVVVFDPVPGHPYGHAAMYTGENWVSDFKQSNVFAAEPYTSGTYIAYRP